MGVAARADRARSARNFFVQGELEDCAMKNLGLIILFLLAAAPAYAGPVADAKAIQRRLQKP